MGKIHNDAEPHIIVIAGFFSTRSDLRAEGSPALKGSLSSGLVMVQACHYERSEVMTVTH
jgi:hypothetical protein